MARMNYPRQNKLRNGHLDKRDELKSAGERWLEKHDPGIKKPTKRKRPRK